MGWTTRFGRLLAAHRRGRPIQAKFRGTTYYVARLRRAFLAHLPAAANVYADGQWMLGKRIIGLRSRGVAICLSPEYWVHPSREKSIRRDRVAKPFHRSSPCPTL